MAAEEGSGFLRFAQPALFQHRGQYQSLILPHLAHPPPVVTPRISIIRTVQIVRG